MKRLCPVCAQPLDPIDAHGRFCSRRCQELVMEWLREYENEQIPEVER